MQNGQWGEEDRSGDININPGQEFHIKVFDFPLYSHQMVNLLKINTISILDYINP